MEARSQPFRHMKIIATLGPATESRERLGQLISAGVDILRLNMAHGSMKWVRETVQRIRDVSAELDRQVAVMMDIKGPEIRTGVVKDRITLQTGDLIEFRPKMAKPSDESIVSVTVNYPELADDIEVGQIVLVDCGLIRLKVLSKDAGRVRCEVITPGHLDSRRHINLPGVHVKLPSLTEKDVADLSAGVAAGIDFVALSFVRQASDVETLRALLDELGSPARIVSKIEEQAGVRNMQEIIRASDTIMVARRDLGIEIAYHQLPLVQTQLVRACEAEGKPVIIATHLLESMINSPMPTRAKISDISNAVREQADAAMLSGETTSGAYPLESVEVFKNIIHSIEPTIEPKLNSRIVLREPKAKMLRSAASLAQELGQSGVWVVVITNALANEKVIDTMQLRMLEYNSSGPDDAMIVFRLFGNEIRFLLISSGESYAIGCVTARFPCRDSRFSEHLRSFHRAAPVRFLTRECLQPNCHVSLPLRSVRRVQTGSAGGRIWRSVNGERSVRTIRPRDDPGKP